MIGYGAGGNLGTTTADMMIGVDAGYNSATGSDLTFLGHYAGNQATSAQDSTFVGYNAGYSLVGNQNTVLGSRSAYVGNQQTNGNDNIIIGYGNASQLLLGSNDLIIGNSLNFNSGYFSQSTTSNEIDIENTIFANTASDTMSMIPGAPGWGLGIGTTTPDAPLDVVGNINIEPTYNYRYNQKNVITASTTLNNYYFGASGQISATGSNNSSLGFSAFNALTSGGNNTAMGELALTALTQGSFNSAFGTAALDNATSSSDNTAVGYQALYNMNLGNNSGFGFQAGRFASSSVANATSTNSLYLGDGTVSLNSGDTNEIVIGHNAVGLGSNTVELGNGSITTTQLQGNVGVGTSTPGQKLTVVGNLQLTGAWFDGTNASGTTGMLLQSTGTSTKWVATSTLGISSGTNYLTQNGNILYNNTGYQFGINSSTPTANLSVEGSSTAPTLPILSVASSSNASYLTVLANGNVGLGTTGSVAKLQINSIAAGAYATNHGDIFLADAGVNGPEAAGGLEIESNSSSLGNGYKIYSNDTNGYMGIAVRYNSASWTNELAIMQQTPEVEIGTTTINSSVLALAQGSILYGINVQSSNSGGYQANFNNNATGNGCSLAGAATAWSCYSDANLKTNITTISGIDALQRLLNVHGVTFNWKTASTSPEQIGVIAQDVQQAFPQAVSTGPSGYLSVQYDSLIGPIISGVNELNLRTNFATSATSSALELTTAPSTVSSATPWVGDFAGASDALKSAVMGIGNTVVHIFNDAIYATTGIFDKIFAKEVHTDLLCVGETCVTQKQFLQMVQSSTQSTQTSNAPAPAQTPPLPAGQVAGDSTTSPSSDISSSSTPPADSSSSDVTPPAPPDSSAATDSQPTASAGQ